VGIDTIASDDGGHRGTVGGGGEEQGGRENVKEYTKRYVRWQIWECPVTGGRGGVCMCTGMTNALFYGNGDTNKDRCGTG
jgi:hypothetical protein